MVLDGRAALRAQGLPVSLVKCLSSGNSVLALLWGSIMGCGAAASLLADLGLIEVANVRDGMPGWRRNHLPLSRDDAAD